MCLLAACSNGGSNDAASTSDTPTGPVAVTPATPSSDEAAVCRGLVNALPDVVADQTRRDVTPDDGTTAAWGDPAIVLRCGVDKPQGFDRFAECTVVNDVDWYVPDVWPETGSLVFSTVGRDVYVEVSLPVRYLPPAATMANLAKPITSTTTVVKRCGG